MTTVLYSIFIGRAVVSKNKYVHVKRRKITPHTKKQVLADVFY
jgi:hypothetical protein